MLNFVFNQIIFYASLAVLFFLPGYFLLLAIFGKNGKLSLLERFVISSGLSIVAIDFLMLFLNCLKISLTRSSILLGVALFITICYAIYKLFRKENTGEENKVFNFSAQQVFLVILLIFLTIFIKTAYLKYNVMPATTDLGHHMYWAKTIVQNGNIPNYEMSDIVASGDNYSIGQPKPISDFIIGEHLPFAAISLVTGLNVISYFPVVFLYLINLLSILAIFIFALRLFEDHPQGKNIAILSLFFIGPLFAVAPPQAKYVAGGVIGNLIGNLLLPLSFYFFYRSLKERDTKMLFSGLVLAMGLFYTHHLTGLIFLLSLILILLAIIVLHFKEIKNIFYVWIKMIFSPPILAFCIFSAVFVLVVYTPTYLTNRAVSTVVGGPVKIEHQGLALGEFKFTVGELRAALGIIGLAIFLLLALKIFKRKSYSEIFLAAWVFLLILISLKPGWTGLSIPSARIANYSVYPLAIIAAFACVSMLNYLINKKDDYFVDRKLLLPVLILMAAFFITSGFYDNAQYAARSVDAQKTVQTFQASQYLASKTGAKDQIVADHIYIPADSWIKLFFMRGYNFPLYRANLDRYANGIDKQEQCTLQMISTPTSLDSQKCYHDLSIDYVMVDKIDGPQFEKSTDFQKIYSDGEISIFYRPRSL